ncbi:MAG: Fic/DOC family N-terminal domain-containing protein [Anaerolineae bacterium]
MRSGRQITQPTGYKAFIPNPLPPTPPIQIMGYLVPNLDHIIAMYVRKEALLSSQIEGTQASLEDIFEYESQIPLKNMNDVEEVVN